MAAIDRRGELTALLGGLLSLLAAALLVVLALWSKSSAVWAASFQMLGAVAIWLISLIQLHQQRLLAEERMEVAELERLRREKLGGVQTIFEEEDLDQMEKLAMGRRLRAIERFLVPAIALATAAYHAVAGAAVLPWRWQFGPIAEAAGGPVLNATAVLFFTGAIAFACFMFSRYALGMSRLADWGLLRAGGDFLFGGSIVCLAISVALLCAVSDLHRVEVWLAYGIGLLMILLAGETIILFVLDFYRPRTPDQPHRPFYDSRLLGMFSEPGGIIRNVAAAVDYQFGFKVSETWFYKLLGQAIVPLLIVQAAVILLLTCIVVVPPGHQAVMTHFGRLVERTAKPGIHFTWFWPIDRAVIIPVERVRRIEVGYEAQGRDRDQPPEPAILWTKKHYKKEYQLLTADRAASATAKTPVNLLTVNMPVQWRVKSADADVVRYYSQSEDVEKILESLAFRELTYYAAGADVLDLLGKGGIEAAQTLHRRIQSACDTAGIGGAGLGVEIVHVGIGGVHPPADQETAKAYEDVVGAIERRDAKIREAEGDAAKTRVAVAGTEWQRLYEAIVREDELLRNSGAPGGAAPSGGELPATLDVERLLREVAGGEARERVARATQQALERVFREQSTAERYEVQRAAYESNPHSYLLNLYLRMLEEGLRDVRKYVIAVRHPDKVVVEVDLKPATGTDVLGAELSTLEQRQEKQP